MDKKSPAKSFWSLFAAAVRDVNDSANNEIPPYYISDNKTEWDLKIEKDLFGTVYASSDD